MQGIRSWRGRTRDLGMLVKLGSGNELGSLLGTSVRISFQPKTAWNRCGQRRRLQRQGRGRGRRDRYLWVAQACLKTSGLSQEPWNGICMIQ